MLNFGQHLNVLLLNELRKYQPELNEFIGRSSDELSVAKRCIAAVQDCYKAQADKRSRPSNIKPGDQVVIAVNHLKNQVKTNRKGGPIFLGHFWVTDSVCKHDTAFRVHLPPPFSGMNPECHVSYI